MKAGLLYFFAACCILSIGGCDEADFGGSLRKGVLAPSLHTKTLADVGGDFGKITTYRQPDARMYQYSIDKALALHKPMVLQFATPGHCSKCDEQLMMLKSLMEIYQPQVLFLHMDQYRNPEAFKAYQVMGDPWTFFIDDKGIVRRVQPGRMLYGEMESGIKELLDAGKKVAKGDRL